jgi:hypothetical protein
MWTGLSLVSGTLTYKVFPGPPDFEDVPPPHLPQAHSAGSTIRSTGLRGPRGARLFFSFVASGAAISALASSAP